MCDKLTKQNNKAKPSQTTNHNREQLIEFQIKNKVSLVYFTYYLLKKYSLITPNLVGHSVWWDSILGGCPGRYSQSFSSGYGDFTWCGYGALILGRAYPRQSTERVGVLEDTKAVVLNVSQTSAWPENTIIVHAQESPCRWGFHSSAACAALMTPDCCDVDPMNTNSFSLTCNSCPL